MTKHPYKQNKQVSEKSTINMYFFPEANSDSGNKHLNRSYVPGTALGNSDTQDGDPCLDGYTSCWVHSQPRLQGPFNLPTHNSRFSLSVLERQWNLGGPSAMQRKEKWMAVFPEVSTSSCLEALSIVKKLKRFMFINEIFFSGGESRQSSRGNE